MKTVRAALEHIDYDYRISAIEPSLDSEGKLFFNEGEKVAIGISDADWITKSKKFAPEWHSELANVYELFLWYAYRIAKGYWDLKYICDDSSSAGNYLNSPDSVHYLELSGMRKVGGFYDGTGNTYKIVNGRFDYNIHRFVADDFDFLMCGGAWDMDGKNAVAVFYSSFSHNKHGTGVMVLKK